MGNLARWVGIGYIFRRLAVWSGGKILWKESADG